MRIFVDTPAFFALLDRDDANHKKAKDVWNKVLCPENVLITTNYILVESFALVQHRLGMDAVMGFQEDILPIINIEWIASGVHRSGVSALLAASRRKLSLVDCISFEIMRNSAIKTIFTFDSHFEEQGFHCIP
ncbi:MAG: PIN domain-containing protein [wastewater metagenome]|nr:PIN domain-containing protein [Candidatus Brocadia sp.]MCF6158985.1 PIN domain-containing protein [Candidatus Loosdrechtia aerotolerans]